MFFPILVDIKKVVIIGGGAEWRRKVFKWSGISDEVLVATDEQLDPDENVTLWKGLPGTDDIKDLIEGATLVISEHPDEEFNAALYDTCQEQNIMINVVDDRKRSNVYATSYIDKPNLLVTISTKGRCAYYTKQLRRELEEELDHRSVISGILGELRKGVPRKYRHEALETVYHDDEFKRLVNSHQYEAARSRALDVGRRYFAFKPVD